MRRAAGIFLLLLALWPAPLLAEAEWISVKRIYDGDTLKLKDGRKVRLIGIDAPELHRNDKLYRDAERTHRDAKTLLKMGKKSYEVLKKLVGKGPVRLEFDQTSRDKYQRSLAYVYVRMKPERFAKAVQAPRPKKGENSEEREYLVNR